MLNYRSSALHKPNHTTIRQIDMDTILHQVTRSFIYLVLLCCEKARQGRRYPTLILLDLFKIPLSIFLIFSFPFSILGFYQFLSARGGAASGIVAFFFLKTFLVCAHLSLLSCIIIQVDLLFKCSSSARFVYRFLPIVLALSLMIHLHRPDFWGFFLWIKNIQA